MPSPLGTEATHPALAWYRATTIEQMLAAQAAFADWPKIASAALLSASADGCPDPLRSAETFPDAGESAALIELPYPAIHPAVFASLARVSGIEERLLRAVATGEAILRDGAVIEDPYAESGETGQDVLMAFALQKLGAPGGGPEQLLARTWPVPPRAARPLRTALAVHPIDGDLRRAAGRCAVISAYQRAGAPAILYQEEHRLLQGCLDNLVAHLRGEEPVSPRSCATNARHVASFLRRDKGEGLDEDALWRWFYGPRSPAGRDEVRCFGERPWAPKQAFVLGLVLTASGMVVVLRYGLLVRYQEQWLPLVRCGPLRPFATGGPFVGLLGTHARGTPAPDVFMLDSHCGEFVDYWPETMPSRFVFGDWGAKSLVIWDRERRRERLLRTSLSDDYGHHFASPDGALVWLADYPEDGVLAVDDGTVVADLSRLGLAKKRGVFPRAFVVTPDGGFRSYAFGVLRHDGRELLRDPERGAAAAFSLDGGRLATATRSTVRVRDLSAEGRVVAETTVDLPLRKADFSAPRTPTPELADILFTAYGPLSSVAQLDCEELVAFVLNEARDRHLPSRLGGDRDRAAFETDAAAWVRSTWAKARSRRARRS